MRRIFATIFISLAFLSLQGGKYAAYMVCRWQVLVVMQQQDCDCEKHLSSADENTQANSSAATLVQKEKAVEFLPIFLHQLAGASQKNIHSFAEYNSPLQNGFTNTSYRPPAVTFG
jgi:hypothetical protein